MFKRLCRSRITWLAFGSLALGLIVWLTVSKSPRHIFNHFKPEDLTVGELIDRLADVSDEGVGTHSTAWVSGFIAVDADSRFRGGVLGSKPPVVNPVMRELVRRGVASLPDLLTHVSDRRSTRLTVRRMMPFFGGTWHSDEYHCRSQDPKCGRRWVED